MEYRYQKLSQYIRGWMNYFGISEYYRPIPEIDQWLKDQGLVSVKELWVNIHYPATAR